jgi:hypothetical protein
VLNAEATNTNFMVFGLQTVEFALTLLFVALGFETVKKVLKKMQSE